MTEKLVQRKRQSSCSTQGSTRAHHSGLYTDAILFTLQQSELTGLVLMWTSGRSADHVNSKARPPHLRPRHGGSTGEREGIKCHWSGSRSHSVPGRQDGGGGQKCRILLVKASRPLRSIDYIEHPWMPLLTSTFTFTKRAYYQLSDWVRHSSSSAEQKKATDI